VQGEKAVREQHRLYGPPRRHIISLRAEGGRSGEDRAGAHPQTPGTLPQDLPKIANFRPIDSEIFVHLLMSDTLDYCAFQNLYCSEMPNVLCRGTGAVRAANAKLVV
jgi:hypothetical protein